MESILSKIELHKRRKILKTIAVSEYENARGTQHLKILKDAKENIELNLTQLSRNRQLLEIQLEELEKTRNQKLRIALEKYIIETRIQEIPGIGYALGSAILHKIYHDNLRDLFKSSWLQGIGGNKQTQINFWVLKYEKLIPDLLQHDFPGKSTIENESNEEISSIQAQISQLQENENIEGKKLSRLNEEVAKLEKVTVDDFIKARLDHEGNSSILDSYFNGAFPEWQEIPVWFKEIIQGE